MRSGQLEDFSGLDSESLGPAVPQHSSHSSIGNTEESSPIPSPIYTSRSMPGEYRGRSQGRRVSSRRKPEWEKAADSMLRSLESSVANGIEKSNKRIALDAKLEAARKRKESIMMTRNKALVALNRKRTDTSRRALQKRFADDISRESTSFERKKDSESYKMMRQVCDSSICKRYRYYYLCRCLHH